MIEYDDDEGGGGGNNDNNNMRGKIIFPLSIGMDPYNKR